MKQYIWTINRKVPKPTHCGCKHTSFSPLRNPLVLRVQSLQFWRSCSHWGAYCRAWGPGGWCSDCGCIVRPLAGASCGSEPLALWASFFVATCEPETGEESTYFNYNLHPGQSMSKTIFRLGTLKKSGNEIHIDQMFQLRDFVRLINTHNLWLWFPGCRGVQVLVCFIIHFIINTTTWRNDSYTMFIWWQTILFHEFSKRL